MLPSTDDGHEWVRVIDTIESHSPEVRFPGQATYPLQGRTLVLFTLDGFQRRASDHAAVDNKTALRIIQ